MAIRLWQVTNWLSVSVFGFFRFRCRFFPASPRISESRYEVPPTAIVVSQFATHSNQFRNSDTEIGKRNGTERNEMRRDKYTRVRDEVRKWVRGRRGERVRTCSRTTTENSKPKWKRSRSRDRVRFRRRRLRTYTRYGCAASRFQFFHPFNIFLFSPLRVLVYVSHRIYQCVR